MIFFNRWPVDKSGRTLSFEWKALAGGYTAVYIHKFMPFWGEWHVPVRFRFAQCFARVGKILGTEKEFIFRLEVEIDDVQKFSWFTFEFINPYEARLFYIWIKFCPRFNFKFVVNFGWRATKEARDYHKREVTESVITRLREVKNNGGGRQWHNRKAKLNVI